MNSWRKAISLYRQIQHLEQLLASSDFAERLGPSARARGHSFVEIRISLIELEPEFPRPAGLSLVSSF
jgi:hypothetical protein